jgi:sortase A
MGLVLSLAAVVAGLAIAGHIGWFYWRSHTVGDALIARARSDIRDGASGVPCDPGAAPATAASSHGGLSPAGLLAAPAIGLQAPVVEGVGNAQLDVAVGHVPGSVWPGQLGTAVLSAHDVSWFSRIDHLHPGDTVTFTDRCQTLRYRVVGDQVVKSGSPLYSTLAPRLTLVTCYPLDALFLTPQRYVVEADLVSVSNHGAGAPRPPVLPPPLVVPAPPALAAQGLTLATNDAPLGTLGLTGSPSVTWQQSPVPLQVESSVLALYFAAVRSAEQRQAAWWQAVAPGVPLAKAAPLAGAAVARNDRSVTPVLDVEGTTVTGATVTARPEVAGGSRPGVYALTMTAAVRGSDLVVTGWSMVPAPG